MCGAIEIQDREAPLEYGESSCAGTTGEAYEPHVTDEQYREAVNRRHVPDADFEEGAEVFSEGEMVPREDGRYEFSLPSTFVVSVEEFGTPEILDLPRPARSSRWSSAILLLYCQNVWNTESFIFLKVGVQNMTVFEYASWLGDSSETLYAVC